VTGRPELPDPDAFAEADLDDALEALGEQQWTVAAVDPGTGEILSAPITRGQFARVQARTVPHRQR
jgi:hypothetical protein